MIYFAVRQDARKRFDEIQPIVAEWRTMDSDCEAFIQDVSSSGVFIKTSRPLLTGPEIALTFMFPKTLKPVMATGEIVRVSYRGVGVKFKVLNANQLTVREAGKPGGLEATKQKESIEKNRNLPKERLPVFFT